MLEGFDSSWIQGNYQPPAWASFGIANASRANVGLTVGSHYHEQVNNFRNAGIEVGHYFFNGNIDPTTCADFFVDNLHDFRAGDTLWLDCEGEAGTGTSAWTGGNAFVWIQRVIARLGVPAGSVGVYANASVLNAGDWGPVAALGCPLWVAAWGFTPDADTIAPWADWAVWQDGNRDGVDHNLAKTALAAFSGAAIPTARQRKDEDMYLEWDTNGTGYLITSRGVLALGSMGIYNILYRVINSDQLKHPNAGFIKTWVPSATGGRPDTFLAAELSVLSAHLHLLDVQVQTGVTVNPDKLAAALKKAGVDVSAEVDPDKLAAAFAKATPQVVDAMLKQAGQKLAQ